MDLGDLADTLLGPRHPRTRSWRCPNPAHSQTGRTPPVSIFTGRAGRQRWHCHGCGEGGTAIDLAIRAGTAADVREAIEWLADRGGVLPDATAHLSRVARRPAVPSPPAGPDADAVRAMAEYVQACAANLFIPEGRSVRRWLTDERAIPAEVLRSESVGADPGPVRLPRPEGLPRGFPAAVFPVRVDGHVVFTQSRLIRHRDRRWLNPRSDLAPNPRVAVLGHTRGGKGPLVVTEGMLDGLSVVAGGHRAAALLGATLATDETIDKIRRASEQVVVATDNDDAGRRARDNLQAGLAAHGVQVSELAIPERFNDLNDWHREARDNWPRTLGSAIHLATHEHAAPPAARGMGLC